MPGFHPQQVCRHVQAVWWKNAGRGPRGVPFTIQCAYLEGAGSSIQSRVGMMMESYDAMMLGWLCQAVGIF